MVGVIVTTSGIFNGFDDGLRPVLTTVEGGDERADDGEGLRGHVVGVEEVGHGGVGVEGAAEGGGGGGEPLEEGEKRGRRERGLEARREKKRRGVREGRWVLREVSRRVVSE
ncbi:hypothetical protein TIFTF001_011493 [Ficus carica]|uniref:Uncharacterized protein n=1 Tax=Ficus carica TaxID=3494 RepID=A0AA87ZU40_FICCA|nr:hypothetical protein TIFTF001_011493 [Ficus carica]